MYKQMYYSLFNAVTEAMEQLEHCEFSMALLTLEQAQQHTEAMFLSVAGNGIALP